MAAHYDPTPTREHRMIEHGGALNTSCESFVQLTFSTPLNIFCKSFIVSLSSDSDLPVILSDSVESSILYAYSFLASRTFWSFPLFLWTWLRSLLMTLFMQHLTVPNRRAAMPTETKNCVWWTLSLVADYFAKWSNRCVQRASDFFILTE